MVCNHFPWHNILCLMKCCYSVWPSVPLPGSDGGIAHLSALGVLEFDGVQVSRCKVAASITTGHGMKWCRDNWGPCAASVHPDCSVVVWGQKLHLCSSLTACYKSSLPHSVSPVYHLCGVRSVLFYTLYNVYINLKEHSNKYIVTYFLRPKLFFYKAKRFAN